MALNVVKRRDLLPPGVCTLCEQTPAEDEDIVDVGRSLITGFPFHLQGVKYVCAPCIKSVSEPLGLVSADVRDAAVRRAEGAEARLVAVVDHLRSFAGGITSGVLEEIAERAPVVVAQHVESDETSARRKAKTT